MLRVSDVGCAGPGGWASWSSPGRLVGTWRVSLISAPTMSMRIYTLVWTDYFAGWSATQLNTVAPRRTPGVVRGHHRLSGPPGRIDPDAAGGQGQATGAQGRPSPRR